MPEFQVRVRELRQQMTENVLSILSTFAASAAITLAELLRSANEKVRLAAAVRILELRHSYSDNCDHEARIAELEAKGGDRPRAYRRGAG